MDISEVVIPEVPIPARILQERAMAQKSQRKITASAKARRKRALIQSAQKRRAN